ncbi:MAG: hypothetical protein OXL97_14545 [Chloroflexota bacterium]|nr:hypothetical protein [Chloroflexota bacterium]MDE2885692.1 hypothetical protein [Chloroflexota bacterium]
MKIATRLVHALKSWLKSRPSLEIEESATWFLLLFVYAQGLTAAGLGFKTDGIVPQATGPQVTLAMTLFCLTLSVLVLVEPLLPCRIRSWTKGARTSSAGQYLRLLSVFFAFVFGMLAGISLLADKVPTMSWLIESVVFVGFFIFVLMGIKLFVFGAIRYWQAARPDESSS